MRMTKVGICLAMLLVASTASAQRGGGQGKGSPGRSSPGIAGGSGTGGGGSKDTFSASEATNLNVTDPDTVAEAADKRKWWEVGGAFETHRMIRQEDTATAENKVFNVFSASIGVDPTPLDHIKLRGFLTQRFIADDGETGWRSEDLILSYSHYFPLKYQMTFKPGAWLTAPTSLASQKSGNVTSPRAYMSLEKEFGRYFRVEPRMYGDANLVKYRSYEGGQANVKYGLGFGLGAELTMPFHTQLSFGMDAGTRYSWYYDVQNSEPNSTGVNGGAQVVQDTQFQNQPIQQTYLFEVYGRYILPTLLGFKSDITLALANGDPSLGSVSVLHGTGVSRVTGGYRNNAEVYASFAVRY